APLLWDKLREQLLSNDIDALYPCKEQDDWMTPLMAAVTFQKEDILQSLLDKGANPDLMNERGFTALHWASDTRAPPTIVGRLLEAKADPNVYLPLSFTALHFAAFNDMEAVVKLRFLELETAVREKTPDEVCKTFKDDMMKEHPHNHFIMIEFSRNRKNTDYYVSHENDKIQLQSVEE
uniref:Uncharacterized protein n=1 Tax=Neogobius melanostomus TaxID=47308 RepID=A0A8C6SEX1_9GOBI